MLKFFLTNTSDSKTFEENATCLEPINPVNMKFFSDRCVILDSYPDYSDNSNIPSGAPVLKKKPKVYRYWI